MPFIYNDQEGDLETDYVEVEFRPLDLTTLMPAPEEGFSRLSYDERLRRNARALFIGNAGVGKTTFQRHAILSLLRNWKNPMFLYSKERVIPIYVPLKAVDNSEPFPILRHLTETNSLFTGRRGVAHLLRYAKKRRLMLFLDGYDEIPFTKHDENYVREEVRSLLEGSVPTGAGEFGGCYENLAQCRIWLSSRREFFAMYPISPRHLPGSLRGRLIPLEISGIGQNRNELARRIFDRYRKRWRAAADLLSEEYFIGDVERCADREIIALSFSPLFLTIMCYVYAHSVLDEQRHDVHCWMPSTILYLLVSRYSYVIWTSLRQGNSRLHTGQASSVDETNSPKRNGDSLVFLPAVST